MSAAFRAGICLISILAAAAVAAGADAAAYGEPGAYRVDSSLTEWTDATRHRTLPVKVYAPQGAQGDLPVVLFSHGLGGSREGGKAWGEHWASHGYLAIHLQHPGSDEAVWKGEGMGAMKALRGAASARQLHARVGDIHFALDELARRKRTGEAPFAAADLDRIGLAGHSFGAVTTLAAGGQTYPRSPLGASPFRDERIKAIVALSPNGRERTGDLDRQFGAIRIPALTITGTKDGDILGDGTTPEDRRKPYAHMQGPDKYLAVFEGGDHMVFGGHILRRTPTQTDRVIESGTRAITVAFWDAYLRNDAGAKSWLAGAAPRALGSMAQFRAK
ncbi:MAG: alpha/beta hydrolase family protein [Usitatibacter sp.]